jgi:hypothetical protein
VLITSDGRGAVTAQVATVLLGVPQYRQQLGACARAISVSEHHPPFCSAATPLVTLLSQINNA